MASVFSRLYYGVSLRTYACIILLVVSLAVYSASTNYLQTVDSYSNSDEAQTPAVDEITLTEQRNGATKHANNKIGKIKNHKKNRFAKKSIDEIKKHGKEIEEIVHEHITDGKSKERINEIERNIETSHVQREQSFDKNKKSIIKQNFIDISNSKNGIKTDMKNLARWIHLDLKGAAPKMGYIKKLLPIWRRMGATGVLIEYEDMFPYDDSLAVLRAKNAYSKFEIKSLLGLLKEYRLEAIPLLQSIGHLEFVLKHPGFEDLREDSRYPCCLNTGKAKALELLKNMTDQVLKIHNKCKFLHIGGDEAIMLGQSVESKKMIKDKKLSGPNDLYLEHVAHLASYIQSKHQGLTVLIWDDMIRGMPLHVLKQTSLPAMVEPVLWAYDINFEDRFNEDIWKKYSMLFPGIWVASAFKGASGSTQHLPDLSKHAQNTVNWLEIIDNMSRKFPKLKVRGMVLTGWSRYDHFSALCDLLPVSLPSLAICLQIVSQLSWNQTILQHATDFLECPKSQNTLFKVDEYDPLELSYLKPNNTVNDMDIDINQSLCNFPGSKIFYTMLKYNSILNNFKMEFDPISGNTRGHCNRFSIGHGFIDPLRVDNLCSSAAKKSLSDFMNVENMIHDVFQSVYDNEVSVEWLEENVINFEVWLKDYNDQVTESSSRSRVWGMRPDKHIDKLQGHKVKMLP